MAFQYMAALGIDVEEFVINAVHERLDSDYSDLVATAEKKHKLPTTQIFKTVRGNLALDWPKSEKVLDGNLGITQGSEIGGRVGERRAVEAGYTVPSPYWNRIT
jgi:hypothetical protein